MTKTHIIHTTRFKSPKSDFRIHKELKDVKLSALDRTIPSKVKEVFTYLLMILRETKKQENDSKSP